ncbi:MAG: hypothetical protein CME25_12490 [Gemmatimonadetes bacterium]|nr:hypothetical protein [Gemmatimonadota bacterium]
MGAHRCCQLLVYSLGSVVSGRLSERLEYRRTMIVASSLAVPMVLLFNFASTVIQILLLSGIIRLSLTGLWPSKQAWLGSGKDRSELLNTLGKYNVCWGLGILVGPLAGGALYSLGTAMPFVFVSSLMGLISIVLILLKVRDEYADKPSPYQPQHQANARQFLPIAWSANFAGFFSAGAICALFPKLTSDLDISSDILGLLLSLTGGVAAQHIGSGAPYLLAAVVIFIVVLLQTYLHQGISKSGLSCQPGD